ncbi:MAG: PAS domain-containing protein [Oceanospirillales bacterium]|uniref:histidine kinase n=1 Tax=Marinobacterium halophilum TaxID=267374 RepID=A0A2P8EKP7_9GAMM|nr:NahK/ErcS family hybrid sensor histidine kinase/response regulator [Marinobacterium halophilum]MBR9828185.1 PAS domain-containing protein [Oceanospirillales bacterium]PSL10022.1 PAS domain S-box-containing protein [Marinobacterium halophilum]
MSSELSREQLHARIAQLEQENSKLTRMKDALIERVEASSTVRTAPYAAFEHSVVLAEQVRERTEALNAALAELKRSNYALKQANQEAATAHQRLIDAIESISDAFVLFDEHHRILLFNSRFLDYWEGTGTEIARGTAIQDVRRLAIERGVIVEEHVGQGDEATVYRLANGRWVQVSERHTGEGGLVILYTDITDLKASEAAQREQALAQKSRLLQSTVDNLSQGVALVNAEGCLEVWNDRFNELAGVRTIEGLSFSQLMRQSEVALLTPDLHDSQGRALHELEQRLQDGRVLEIRTHPMPAGGFVNTYTDITERYQSAETLRENEHWLRLITDHVPALIAYVGEDGCFQFTNQVYDDWYGWPRGTIIGQSIRQIHGDPLYARLEPHILRAMGGENATFEIDEFNAAGENRHMLKSYVPNLDQEGRAVGFFVLIRDITERKRTALALQQAYQNLEQRVRERTSELTEVNQQLRQEIDERMAIEARLLDAKQDAEQANLSKTKFLAAVSHDLLQPLNAARLFTGALLEQAMPERISSLIGSVSNSLQDVETLLGTLVDISKLDAGVIKPDVGAFRLNELLRTLAAEYTQMAAAEGLTFRFSGSDAVVMSDATLLARILRNFLTNALRYTDAGGEILLGCRRRAGKLVIEVWDTGSGIPADKLTEIFQEFRRIPNARHQHDKGLGLGLAIVDKISSMLDHPIKVRSQEGVGSVFSVMLPLGHLNPQSFMPQFKDPAIDSQLQGARIWMVDNDASICAGMATLLGGWGCEVVTALSLEDLQEQLSLGCAPLDLLIADYHLDDGVTGVDLVREILQQRADTPPVMMITANYSNELKQELKEQGYLLMNKPIRPLKLKATLAHLLQRRT